MEAIKLQGEKYYPLIQVDSINGRDPDINGKLRTYEGNITLIR